MCINSVQIQFYELLVKGNTKYMISYNYAIIFFEHFWWEVGLGFVGYTPPPSSHTLEKAHIRDITHFFFNEVANWSNSGTQFACPPPHLEGTLDIEHRRTQLTFNDLWK